MKEKSPQKQIADAARIKEFFRDEVIQEAMQTVERDFIEEMIAADTSEKRAKAQGKVVAIRALTGELAAMLSAGERAVLEIAKAEAKKPQ